ncbi:DivIVA domain-containing protein [Kineococcus gypseus]|uniref:DivIVA domain-containing protein n=1 Tax=Kineococcus gypseus TaxID=1637102 RepID=UPI003D7C98D0
MPLSPEDVVEKRFNPTRVREGYAQDEVDDFLDEVVTELRRLNAENDELRSQLQQCRARVAQLSGTTPAAASDDAVAPEAGRPLDAQDVPAREVPAQDVPGPREGAGAVAASALRAEGGAPVEDAEHVRDAERTPRAGQPSSGEQPAAADAPGADPTSQAAGVIALAQRLHDEYVREGQQQRDALLEAARQRAEQTVSEAEQQRERTLQELQERRRLLEEAIVQLREREGTYREQLESFMAGQLEELRRSGRVVPDDAAAR